MGEESLESIHAGWNGFDGDRRWAFIRGGLVRSGFPWLTIRENPSMWKYSPHFADPGDPDQSTTLVRTPSGAEYDVVDPVLARELGHDARVIKQDRGIFDTMPLSLISVQTIEGLSASVGTALAMRRFRPNIVIDSDHGDGGENAWVGKTISVGGMQMRVDKRDKRCVMINVDPETTERNAAVLRAVAQEREACLGVYGTVAARGMISVGDTVAME
jgi:uncharacterized protein YcbX